MRVHFFKNLSQVFYTSILKSLLRLSVASEKLFPAIAITLLFFPSFHLGLQNLYLYERTPYHFCLASPVDFLYNLEGTSLEELQRLDTVELLTCKEKQRREHTFSRVYGLRWLFCGLLCIGMAVQGYQAPSGLV